MGFTNAKSKAILDQEFPTSAANQGIALSVNGSSETTIIARIPTGATGWAAATLADPSVKTNGSTFTSAAATGAGTITHWCVFSATSGGTQITEWVALTTPRAIVAGDKFEADPGTLTITMN